MSKRKLSHRQSDRIAKIQQKRVEKAQKKMADQEAGLADITLNPEQRGRVIANYGAKLFIETIDGSFVTCKARQNIGALVVGDYVIWQGFSGSENEGVIVALVDRRSLLSRNLYHGIIKPVAANVDQILIFVSPLPAIQPALIDRYLVATEIADITPVVVFNKTDLLDKTTAALVNKLEHIYTTIGYQCLRLSNKTGMGKEELDTLLKDKTSILVGQSGVGKSSTIKQLLPDIDIQISSLSNLTALGKHTTSVSRLYHLPHSGEIIDSPGVRDFGLWHLEQEKVLWGFKEFRPFIGKCKFSNCSHQHEPQCALQEAVTQGLISSLRLENYFSIIANQTARQD